MTAVLETPALSALTDEELRDAYLAALDDNTRAMLEAEAERRDRAERTAARESRKSDAEDQLRYEWYDAMHAQRMAAEAFCGGGGMLNHAGLARKVSEWDMWTAPWSTVQRYGSEDLIWFFEHKSPRMTFSEYKRQRNTAGRIQREEWRDRHEISSGGNDDEHELAGPEPRALRRDETTPEAPQAGPGRSMDRGGPAPAGDGDSNREEPGTDGGAGGPVQPGRVGGGGGDMDANGSESTAPGPDRIAPGARRKMPLDEARKFGGEIWWTDDVQLDVFTAAIAATHALHSFNTTFRVLVRSKEKRTGKTTTSDIVEILGLNAWRATTSTSHGIKSKFNEADPPLIIVEEIQKRFGVNGLSGSKDPLATFLLDGYRRTATTPLSVDRATVDVPSYCAAFLNGRGEAVHDDILDRCIVLQARRKPAGIAMPRNSLDQDTWAEGATLREALHAYVKNLEPLIAQLQRKWHPPHPLFVDRLDQIWRSVYLVALASDIYERELWEKACAAAAEQGLPDPPRPACDWADRIMSGFRLIALDNSDIPPLLNEQKALRDAARWFRSGGGWKDDLGRRFGFAADLKNWLVEESDEPLWRELTERAMERLFTEALGETSVLTHNPAGGEKRRARGWAADPVLRGWDALEASFLPSQPDAQEEVSIFDELPPEDNDHSNHGTDGTS